MHLKNSKKIVIKIGSSLLVDKSKKIRVKWLSEFSKDIKQLLEQNKKIIIVSSGAIAIGCKKLNINKKNLKLDKSQAIASIGQIELMNLFNKTFSKSKINISQILLTLEDTEKRRRSMNAKRTFENLFELGFVPIVNENDSTATTEIKYGDNDRLASRVAQISGADCLILLSDVDGLYTKNPKLDKNVKLIKEINNIDNKIEKISTSSTSEHGTGGMKTKIDAAKICQLSGCVMAIANGLLKRPIQQIIKKNNCTWFLPKISKLDARKKWIVGSIAPRGKLMIDDGAKIIDVGGCSTKPGSENVDLEEEWKRIGDIIEEIRKNFPNIIVSVDTFRSQIVKRCFDVGIDMVNDVSAGEFDSKMFEVVSKLKLPYVLMHNRGNSKTMMNFTNYNNLLSDMISFFVKKIEVLHSLKMKDIIIDPGFGFAKTYDQNIEILDNLDYFSILDSPILVGLSRKSFIQKKFNVSLKNSLGGSLKLNKIALKNNASILRVHDVKETKGLID